MTEQSNVAMARACYAAYVSKDRAAIEALIAEDFHFTSPRDNRIDRRTYFERCWPGGQDIEAFDFVHLAPAGDCVFVTYEARMRGGRRFRNTEILSFRGGHIVGAEVYFGWTLPHAAPDGGFVDGEA
jgi:ketosteroid isomerase-like protein